MFFQRPCAGCRSTLRAGRSPRGPLCSPCTAALEPVGPLRGVPGLPLAGVLFRYDGPARRAIVAAKTGARPDVLRLFGRQLAPLARRVTSGHHRPAIVTWVPASRQGVRDRGYDQGRLLASTVAAALGLPAKRLLIRGPDSSRMGRDRSDRLAGPDLLARGGAAGPVLIVDDVITTGASISSAANALRSAGASPIAGVAVALVASAEEVAGRLVPSEPWEEAPPAPAQIRATG